MRNDIATWTSLLRSGLQLGGTLRRQRFADSAVKQVIFEIVNARTFTCGCSVEYSYGAPHDSPNIRVLVKC